MCRYDEVIFCELPEVVMKRNVINTITSPKWAHVHFWGWMSLLMKQMRFESVAVGFWSSGVSLLKKVLRKKGQKPIHKLTMEQQEPTLLPDLMEEGVALWLNGVENALAQKRKSRFPIHGAFQEFQFRHLSLDLSVVDGPSEARFHCRFVLLHSSRKWLKFCQVAGGNAL